MPKCMYVCDDSDTRRFLEESSDSGKHSFQNLFL